MEIKSCRVLIKAQEMENNSHYGKERARVKKKTTNDGISSNVSRFDYSLLSNSKRHCHFKHYTGYMFVTIHLSTTSIWTRPRLRF